MKYLPGIITMAIGIIVVIHGIRLIETLPDIGIAVTAFAWFVTVFGLGLVLKEYDDERR